MRTLFFATVLLAIGASAPLTAQSNTPASASAPQPKSWELVEALTPGTKIHIKFFTHAKTDCRVSKVDDDTISCDTSAVFKRADIESIRSNHRLRSTIIGAVIGYFAAAGVTAAADRNDKCGGACAAVVGVVDLALFIAVPIVAHITDFTASTIYRSPACVSGCSKAAAAPSVATSSAPAPIN